MMILAEFPFNSNVIVILVAVIFAAVKAFLERKQGGEEIDTYESEEDQGDPYEQYEAELQRQREEMQIEPMVVRPVLENKPPPLPAVARPQEPIRPTLSTAEKKALENLKLRSTRKKKHSTQSTKSRVYRHLSSPTAAREALLLVEVLGPPKAFKDEP